MSRTRHKEKSSRARAPRQTPRPSLTKGKAAGEYSPSTIDAPSNLGKPGSWSRWLHDYNGYAKQRRQRRHRKIMKVHGRRVDRRRRNLAAEPA